MDIFPKNSTIASQLTSQWHNIHEKQMCRVGKSCNVAIISVKDKRKLYCARKHKNLAFCMNLFFMFIFMNHSSILQVTNHERQLVQLKYFQFSTNIE